MIHLCKLCYRKKVLQIFENSFLNRGILEFCTKAPIISILTVKNLTYSWNGNKLHNQIITSSEIVIPKICNQRCFPTARELRKKTWFSKNFGVMLPDDFDWIDKYNHCNFDFSLNSIDLESLSKNSKVIFRNFEVTLKISILSIKLVPWDPVKFASSFSLRLLEPIICMLKYFVDVWATPKITHKILRIFQDAKKNKEILMVST